MLAPRNTQSFPGAVASLTPVFVVRLDQLENMSPIWPKQWVISATATVKKSAFPCAGDPVGASPANALTMFPSNSQESNGVGSRNHPLSSDGSGVTLPWPITNE